MPKAIDLRLKGIKFEDALLKMLKTPPMPPIKPAKRARAKRGAK